MSVKIKLKGRSERLDRNGHTPLYSITHTGCGIFTREGGWFGPGPSSPAEGKWNLLESHGDRNGFDMKRKSALCVKLDASREIRAQPHSWLKRRRNFKYETCFRAVKCTYIINVTVKYTRPEDRKAAGKNKRDESLQWLLATTSIYVQNNIKSARYFTVDTNTLEKKNLITSG